jgi:hypothetical protein
MDNQQRRFYKKQLKFKFLDLTIGIMSAPQEVTAVAPVEQIAQKKTRKKPPTTVPETGFGWIYRITCLVTMLVYIGQTSESWKHRWSGHKKLARLLAAWYEAKKEGVDYPIKWKKSLLYNAMYEHGIDNFKIEPILYVPVEQLNEVEIAEIAKHGSFGGGYNATKGGGGSIPKALRTEMEETVKAKRISFRNKQSDVIVTTPSGHKYIKPFNKAGRHGYTITKHPLCKDKSFVISKEYPTEEDCLEAAIAFQTELEASGQPYVHKWKKDDSLPEGLTRFTHGGWVARMQYKGQLYTATCRAGKEPDGDAKARAKAEAILKEWHAFRDACKTPLPKELNEKEL